MMSEDVSDILVDYQTYCKTCKHESLSDAEMPCDECLENPVNYGTSKPVNWEEA